MTLIIKCMINLFIYSFYIYLLRAYYMAGTELATGNVNNK